VVLASGQVYEATVIEAEPDLDLALIKIDAEDLPAIPIDADREMKQGYAVVSIGSPKGLVGTMSTGIITALNRDALDLEDLYQTDANIAPGSSGGPLIDEYGNLIGVNVAVAQESGVSLTAFGFAIPIGQAEDLLGYVRNLAGRRSDVLTVPGIAEACSPATVYIVCTREVPLLSLLPTALSIYAGGLCLFYDTASDAFTPPTENSFMANVREAFKQNLEERTSRQGRDWAATLQGLDTASTVSVILCENAEDGDRIAELEREYETDGCTAISRGTYALGDLVADWEIGQGSVMEFQHYSPPGDVADMNARSICRLRAKLVSVATLVLDHVVLVVGCAWTSNEFTESRPAAGANWGESSHLVDFEIEDGCLIKVDSWVEIHGLEEVTSTSRTELICVDDFESVAQTVFQEAVSALAASL